MLTNQSLRADATGRGAAVQRGRPAGDHEAKRAELLKAATEVMAEDGYARTSLRRVAERAGYTTGAVTYYFANKEELIVAVAQSRFDRYDAMLDGLADEIDVRVVFERFFALTAVGSPYGRAMSQLMAYAPHEPAVAGVIRERYARYRHAHTVRMKAAQRRGTVRSDIPADILVEQLSAMGDGIAMIYPVDAERFTREHIDALVDAAVTLISPS